MKIVFPTIKPISLTPERIRKAVHSLNLSEPLSIAISEPIELRMHCNLDRKLPVQFSGSLEEEQVYEKESTERYFVIKMKSDEVASGEKFTYQFILAIPKKSLKLKLEKSSELEIAPLGGAVGTSYSRRDLDPDEKLEPCPRLSRNIDFNLQQEADRVSINTLRKFVEEIESGNISKFIKRKKF